MTLSKIRNFRSPIPLYAMSALGVLPLLLVSGCTTKKYVRSQTEPVIQHTNELDDATARNNRNIHDVDARATAGIQQAQNSANNASQQAQTANQAANTAQASAADPTSIVPRTSNTCAALYG